MTVGATRLPDTEPVLRTMPFDQFGRYHVLREAIDVCRTRLGKQTLSILDVGGFFRTREGHPTLPLRQFLPHDDITVLDVVDCDLAGYVQGDGANLQFAAASFDLVVSADTLEHVPGPQRADFWRELLRVARHALILAAPFGTVDVEVAEELLFEYIKIELGVEQPQLREHRDYGLPRLDEWLAFLQRDGLIARAYPIGYLHAWLGMMLIKHTRLDGSVRIQQLIDEYYNRCYFATERREPAYRHLIVVEKTAGLVDAVDAVLAPTIMPPQADTSALWGNALMPALMLLMQRQVGNARSAPAVQSSEQSPDAQAVADQQALLARLQEQLIEAHSEGRRQAQQYEAALRDLHERANWLERQTMTLRHQLEAVQNGLVLRFLNRVVRRKKA